jgi:hypothetical protein
VLQGRLEEAERLLEGFIFTPGGFEDVLREISRPADRRTLPPDGGPSRSDEDLRRMAAAIQAHGCELLE